MALLEIPVPSGAKFSLAPDGMLVEGNLLLLTAQPGAPGATVSPGFNDSRTIYLTSTANAPFVLSVSSLALD